MSRDLFHLNEDDERPPRKGGSIGRNELIPFEMVLHYDNPVRDAIQVSDTGEESRAVWLPRSQIQMNPSGKKVPAVKRDGQHTILPVVTVAMPEWLAKEKGLI